MGTHINQKTNLKDLDIKITKIYKDKLDNFRNTRRNRNIHVRVDLEIEILSTVKLYQGKIPNIFSFFNLFIRT